MNSDIPEWLKCPNCKHRLMVLFSVMGFRCNNCGYARIVDNVLLPRKAR